MASTVGGNLELQPVSGKELGAVYITAAGVEMQVAVILPEDLAAGANLPAAFVQTRDWRERLPLLETRRIVPPQRERDSSSM